jgi:hypothetical protein
LAITARGGTQCRWAEGQGSRLPALAADLAGRQVIAPAEEKVRALQERRRLIEAELTKP